MQSAVIPNRPASDYLLAEGGGVWGKFNQTDHCLRTDYGKALSAIATDVRKIALVPFRSWKGWEPRASSKADSLSVALRP